MDKKITACLISRLLLQRHVSRNDLYVDECSMGSSGSRRLDGWAMSKSWASPMYTGYEIKISRSDFLQDEKYDDYFKVCSRFYWVCPTGLIDKSEVGDNCGLIYVTKSGNRLITKKKAPALVPNQMSLKRLMKSVLMNRVKICDSTFNGGTTETNQEFWERWLREKQSKLLLGRSVCNELHRRVNEKILETRNENQKLARENFRLQGIKELLEELGINKKSDYYDRWSVEQKLQGKHQQLVNALEHSVKKSEEILYLLKEAEQTEES